MNNTTVATITPSIDEQEQLKNITPKGEAILSTYQSKLDSLTAAITRNKQEQEPVTWTPK